MHRVMLIDDEESARKLLKASIDWESLNMEVAGEAESGIEAINIIDEIKPDIAFVDISMPFMNGIDFAEIATKRYPNLIIIMVTAMDQFEYARRCVSLHVFEYILKPIDRYEVIAALKKVKQLLDIRQSENSEVLDGENSNEMEASFVEQIKKYIETNYTDSRINLTSVAQNFGFSTSYLSRKFKQETGKNFVEYLTECRMNAAMELAKSNMKMFNASSEVGIPDPNYFGRCFKKYTGMSYSEYVANKALNQGQN